MSTCDTYDHFTLMASMPTPTSTQASQAMAADFPLDPRLAPVAVYALPRGLIDAIVKECPELLTTDDLRFEYRLACLSGGGFFAQQPLIYPGLDLAQPESGDLGTRRAELMQQQREIGHEIDRLAVETVVNEGGHAAQYAEYQRAIKSSQEAIQLRRVAYAAWLATDSTFRAELDTLRTRWSVAFASQTNGSESNCDHKHEAGAVTSQSQTAKSASIVDDTLLPKI